MRSIGLGLAATGLAALLANCTSVPAPSVTADQLAGSSWHVAGLNAGGVQTRSMTITFEEGGQATGNAACNDFRTAYRLEGGRLRFGNTVFLSGNPVCDQDTRETQTRFLATLHEINRASIAPSGSLVLYTSTTNMRITARPIP